MFCSVQCGKISPTPTGSAVWITCLTFQPIHSWRPCIFNLCCWVLALYRLLRTALPKEMVQNVSISVHKLSCIDHIFMTLLAVFFCFVFFIVADVLQCPMWQDFSYAYRLRSMNHVSHLPADGPSCVPSRLRVSPSSRSVPVGRVFTSCVAGCWPSTDCYEQHRLKKWSRTSA